MITLNGPSTPFCNPGIISILKFVIEIISRTKSSANKLPVKNINPFRFLAVIQVANKCECWQYGSATQVLQIEQCTALDCNMLQLGHIRLGSTPSLSEVRISSTVLGFNPPDIRKV